MFTRRGFWHPYQAHDRTHRRSSISPTVHDFAHIQYEILYGLFQFILLRHIL